MQKLYLTAPLNRLDKPGWLRLQPAAIDRVLGSMDILDHGVEDGIPWVEVAGGKEVQKISGVLVCNTEKPAVPGSIEQQVAEIRKELSVLRTAFETAKVIAAKVSEPAV